MVRDGIIAAIAGIVGTALALLISRDWIVWSFQRDPLSFISSVLLLLLFGIMIGLAISIVHKLALDSRMAKVARQTIAEEIVPMSLEDIDKLLEEDLSSRQ